MPTQNIPTKLHQNQNEHTRLCLILCHASFLLMIFLGGLAWEELQSETADVACGRRPVSGPLSGPVSGPVSGNPGIYSI